MCALRLARASGVAGGWRWLDVGRPGGVVAPRRPLMGSIESRRSEEPEQGQELSSPGYLRARSAVDESLGTRGAIGRQEAGVLELAGERSACGRAARGGARSPLPRGR